VKGNLELAVFDIYGTVVVDDGAVENSLKAAFSSVGVGITSEDLLPLKGVSKGQTIKKLCNEHFNEDEHDYQSAGLMAADVYDAYQRNVLLSWRERAPVEVPGATEVIMDLRASGVKVAFTTGFEKGLAFPLLVTMGWDTHKMPYISSDMVTRGRPEPDMIFAAMQKHGVLDPKNVLAVGDAQVDIIAAANAGVGINVRVEATAPPERIGSLFVPVQHYRLRTVAELPLLLR
jgi:phosphonatase-like hydrolase